MSIWRKWNEYGTFIIVAVASPSSGDIISIVNTLGVKEQMINSLLHYEISKQSWWLNKVNNYGMRDNCECLYKHMNEYDYVYMI